MNLQSYGALPGITALRQTAERAIWWGRQERNLDFSNLLISSAAVDAGSTPTTDLRAGLVLGRVTASGELKEWNPDGVDGSEAVAGVLLRDISMLSDEGVAEDKYGHVLLAGCVRAADLLVAGTVFTSSTSQYLARAQMVGSGRFIFDDDVLGGSCFLGVPLRTITDATQALTPSVGQNGSRFLLTNAATVTVTLPTIQAGLVYQFLRIGDEELIVTSAEGDNVIVGNDLSADSITFTTAGNHLGACVTVEGIIVGGALKWLMTLPNVPIGTGVNTLPFSLAS